MLQQQPSSPSAVADEASRATSSSNANLEQSIALTAPQTNRTLNTRANPGGPIAQAQAKGLVSVEQWVHTLSGEEEEEVSIQQDAPVLSDD